MDAALFQRIPRLVDKRPTSGYRRVTVLLNRELASENRPLANHKRVYRIMKQHDLLLARHTAERSGRAHDGKVIFRRSI